MYEDVEQMILLDILNPNKNGLRAAPPEYKFMISCVLAAFWCVAFGIYTAELLFIGYSIIGHIILIFMVFVTWTVFKNVRKHSPPSPPNKVQWDLEREG